MDFHIFSIEQAYFRILFDILPILIFFISLNFQNAQVYLYKEIYSSHQYDFTNSDACMFINIGKSNVNDVISKYMYYDVYLVFVYCPTVHFM